MVFSAVQILLFAHGRDQTIYATVADGILHGEMPYRDRWDFKPPGIFLVHALALASLGQNMWGVRLLEVAAMAAMAYAFIKLSLRFWGSALPGYLGSALAFWVHAQLEFWHSGQPELFGGVLTALGLLWATSLARSLSAQRVYWFSSGLAFGVAFLMKPPLGGGALVCALYLMLQRKRRGESMAACLAPAAVVCGGVLLPIAACIVWFWTRGALEDLVWTLFRFTPGYTKLGWSDNAAAALYFAFTSIGTKFSALLPLGALLALGLSAPVSLRERELVWLLLAVASLHLAGIAMQAKFFQYHFSGTLPLLALYAGLGFAKLWRVARRQGDGGAVALLSLFVLAASAKVAVTDVPHGYAERCRRRVAFLFGSGAYPTRAALDRELYYVADYNLGANRDVAARVRALTAPNDTLYVWGFEPSLYQLSQRMPASRYIYNVPQRVAWERERAMATLLADLAQRPPTVVVVQRNDIFRFVTGDDSDSRSALGAFPELATDLERNFELAGEIEDFQIFLRRPTT